MQADTLGGQRGPQSSTLTSHGGRLLSLVSLTHTHTHTDPGTKAKTAVGTLTAVGTTSEKSIWSKGMWQRTGPGQGTLSAENQRAQKVEEELMHIRPFKRIHWNTQAVIEHDSVLIPWPELASLLVSHHETKVLRVPHLLN